MVQLGGQQRQLLIGRRGQRLRFQVTRRYDGSCANDWLERLEKKRAGMPMPPSAESYSAQVSDFFSARIASKEHGAEGSLKILMAAERSGHLERSRFVLLVSEAAKPAHTRTQPSSCGRRGDANVAHERRVIAGE